MTRFILAVLLLLFAVAFAVDWSLGPGPMGALYEERIFSNRIRCFTPIGEEGTQFCYRPKRLLQ